MKPAVQKRRTAIVLCAALLLFSSPRGLPADTVVLKNGEELDGTVIQAEEEAIILDTAGGPIRIKKSSIVQVFIGSEYRESSRERRQEMLEEARREEGAARDKKKEGPEASQNAKEDGPAAQNNEEPGSDSQEAGEAPGPYVYLEYGPWSGDIRHLEIIDLYKGYNPFFASKGDERVVLSRGNPGRLEAGLWQPVWAGWFVKLRAEAYGSLPRRSYLDFGYDIVPGPPSGFTTRLAPFQEKTSMNLNYSGEVAIGYQFSVFADPGRPGGDSWEPYLGAHTGAGLTELQGFSAGTAYDYVQSVYQSYTTYERHSLNEALDGYFAGFRFRYRFPRWELGFQAEGYSYHGSIFLRMVRLRSQPSRLMSNTLQLTTRNTGFSLKLSGAFYIWKDIALTASVGYAEQETQGRDGTGMIVVKGESFPAVVTGPFTPLSDGFQATNLQSSSAVHYWALGLRYHY